MKRHLPALITWLVLSLGLGAAMGHLFFDLYEQTVPAALTTNFNKGTAHAAYIGYGLVAGLVMFLWSLLAVAGAKFFPKKRD